MKIVVISDTHNKHKDIIVPDGDLLIHCGDFSMRGTAQEAIDFNTWVGTLPHKYKLLVYGNHDFIGEQDPVLASKLLSNIKVLTDQSIEIEGIKFYGTPWVPLYGNWAFMKPDYQLEPIFNAVPEDTDVLITHGPPFGILDKTKYGDSVGSKAQRFAKNTHPRLSVFGHIHEAYGTEFLGETVYWNASSCDVKYRPINKAVTEEVMRRNSV